MGTVSEAPYRLSFDTGVYSAGQHTLSATARTAGGQTLEASAATVEFLSAAQAGEATGRIAFPLLGAVLVLIIAGAGFSYFVSTRRPQPYIEGRARSYGPAGGAICVRCGRPFARNFLSLNLFTGKLERCPYCQKWQLAKRAGPTALAAAEAAEIEASKPTISTESPEEKLRRQIEESRYR
jgi:hypothetical protein